MLGTTRNDKTRIIAEKQEKFKVSRKYKTSHDDDKLVGGSIQGVRNYIKGYEGM